MYMLILVVSFYVVYVLGADTCNYYQVNAVLATVLMIARYFLYRRRLWHLYVLEFCYFGNLVVVLFSLVYRDSSALFVAGYAYSCGPLAVSAIVLYNCYVPHSLDKCSSFFYHLSPTIVMYTFRYSPCSDLKIV
jgi:hypothetical protein